MDVQGKVLISKQGAWKIQENSGVSQDPSIDFTGDSAWFSSRISQSVDGKESLLKKLIDSSNVQKSSFNEKLESAIENKDPMDFLEVSRTMSENYLQTMLATKIISKSIQSIEKLTSQH